MKTLVAIPAEYDETPLRLQLHVQGGLHCCGTTTIQKVELVRL
jgi:hypothetical protein